MKKTFILSMIAIAIISSCSKSSSSSSTPTPTPPAFTGSMSADVDGVKWTATQGSATLLRDFDLEAKRFDITGTGGDKRIILSLQDVIQGDYITQKSYSFKDMSSPALCTFSTVVGLGSLTKHMPFDGTVTISKCDATKKTVDGTFQFRSIEIGTDDTLKVTHGVFSNISYVVLN
jgi:CubicO group peptidase (beta-lactamase class C family)